MNASSRAAGERTRLACWFWRPRQNNLWGKVRDRGGAIASTRGRVRSPELCNRALLTLASSCLLLGVIWFFLPKPPLLKGVSFSQCVRDRNGNLLRVTLSADQKFRIWTPLREISPELIAATLKYEDKHYAKHPGVNLVALGRSIVDLARFQRITTGGSTITMQLARLRFHLRTRTISGKLLQIFRALQLERHHSKNEILEAYLNLAPYGRNIEGIEAASEIYFGKSAAQLSGPEAISLSIIPQSPAKRALFAERDNDSVNIAQNKWYDRAKIDNYYLREFRARARVDRKLLAPHFVQQVLESAKGRDQIITTLDLEKQQLIERRISEYIVTNQNRGIRNAAAMLIDTRSMDVLAQVGSADFGKIDINGQVDGTRALRSPGSTLKPFVYALALEQGLIHPLSILSDAPRSFGEYNPENFDREFLGPIRASDALARSRNVPAVELASHLSRPTLFEFLKNAEVHFAKPASFYGLSLPLGGAEVSMQDLVRLYASLVNTGRLRPLRHIRQNRSENLIGLTDQVFESRRVNLEGGLGRQILSPGAAFLALEMLGNVPRPELNCTDGNRTAPVFWKTGTSHGFRDAWSVAVFDHYVLAVWIGNFNGCANPEFVGRTAAAPLLFQIIDSLRASWPEPNEPHLPPPGANLKRVEFCAGSGDLPNAFCRDRVAGWFIPGVSPIKTCEVHREVLVDLASGLRVAMDDGTHKLKREVYEFWPGDLRALFEKAGVPRKTPPPFLPDSSDVAARTGRAPQITSLPNIGIVISTAAGIPLQAKAEADVRDIYWFAGRSFLGTTKPQAVLAWKTSPGDYQIIAMDDHGRARSCEIKVR